jgi:hypothetical protein
MSKQDKILTYMYTCVMTTFYNTTIKSLDCSLVKGLVRNYQGGGRGAERARVFFFSALQKGGSLKTEPLKREGHKILSHNFHKGGS